jgi:demethylmenaquinone methyltransferase/2-methoxy-6-polyprenyl-1,4-benzoquinol methylase
MPPPQSMRSAGYRVRYYDAFSRVYDRFVAAHSSDREGRLRQVLADRAALPRGARALDLCTGTGAMLPSLARSTGTTGLVVGLDFSRGMLECARTKVAGTPGVALVRADAERLPFREGRFDAVTCSHAFYELKGEGAERALKEVARTLKPCGSFLVMEHEVPQKLLVRLLFYVRLLSMGLRKALAVLGNEDKLFRRHFHAVERIATDTGRSKIILGRGPRNASHDVSSVPGEVVLPGAKVSARGR